MKPNILFIVWDTVRYDHLSCYGYKRQTTPFLDSILKAKDKICNFGKDLLLGRKL